ncbi:MAG TPA: circularly permuted type 2 ATP-grasp protein, partial [Chthoniobacteraceae bacterium]
MQTQVPFDELWGRSNGDACRYGLEALSRWLSESSHKDFARRQQSAEATFRNLGITFSLYGEEGSAERIIPFDIIPRIFTAREWDDLSAGLEQRVWALNAFVKDIYGDRKIIADGIVPADIILGNPQFCIPMAGVRPAGGIYAHICGIDLVRTG